MTSRLSLLLVGFLAGCGSGGDGRHYGTTDRVGGRDEATFYLNNGTEPEYMDPGLASESAGTSLARNMFEGLVIKHPQDLRPIAGVATRWAKSEDNRIYRFYLRDDARWSDGAPVVAAHFVDAWQRVLTPATGARFATYLYPLRNGQLYHRGRIKAVVRDVTLGKEALATGSAVRVLATMPVKAMVPALPAPDAERMEMVPGAPGKPATLSPFGKSPVAADAPRDVAILEVGAKVDCNDTADRWFKVSVDGQDGWLPGCALIEAKGAEAKEALVEAADRPSFLAKAPATPTVRASGLVPIDALADDPTLIGMRAVSDTVLEVELERPTPYFLEVLSIPTAAPIRKEIIAQHGDRWTRPENIITNGPYTLDEHKFRYEISLKANPHYHSADQLKIRRVVWLAVTDSFAMLNLYKAGEIDWIGENVALPTAFIDLVKKYDDYDISNWITTYWYEFNTSKPPVDNPLVRHALDLAVDKQQLIDKIVRGDQLPARHFVPPFTGGGYAEAHEADVKAGRDPFSGPGHDFDPERARDLLRQAGYTVEKNGDVWEAKGFPALEILYNTHEAHQKIAVAIQGMWREHLGITAQIRNEEWKVMIKNLRDGNFQVARFGWSGDFNHTASWMDTFLSFSNNNWTRYRDPKFDRLIDQAAATADPVESIRIYRQAEARMVEAMPRLPLYFYTKQSLIKPYVKGYWPNADNKHPIQWIWIDKDWASNPENTTAYPVTELPSPELL